MKVTNLFVANNELSPQVHFTVEVRVLVASPITQFIKCYDLRLPLCVSEEMYHDFFTHNTMRFFRTNIAVCLNLFA